MSTILTQLYVLCLDSREVDASREKIPTKGLKIVAFHLIAGGRIGLMNVDYYGSEFL